MASAENSFTISNDAMVFFAVGPARLAAGPSEQYATSDATGNVDSGRIGWADIIEGRLADWARDTTQLEEEGLTAPNAATIARAFLVASTLRDKGASPPDRVVPTGDGGIAFQFERGREFISVEVEPEGVVELLVFEEGRLKHRVTL